MAIETLSSTSEVDQKADSPQKSGIPVTWSIRGVERETRSIIEKAAERSGKTLGQYLNEDVRRLVQGELSQSQVPAAPVDIQNQIDHLTKIVEGIASRIPDQGKKSFWQRFFS